MQASSTGFLPVCISRRPVAMTSKPPATPTPIGFREGSPSAHQSRINFGFWRKSTKVSVSCPLRKTSRVGMVLMPYCCATPGFSSTLTLPIWRCQHTSVPICQ